jgi:hypothetical protein
MSKLNYSYDSLIFTRTSVWRVYVRRYIVSYIDTALGPGPGSHLIQGSSRVFFGQSIVNGAL